MTTLKLFGEHQVRDGSIVKLERLAELRTIHIDETSGTIWIENNETKKGYTIGQRTNDGGWTWGADLNHVERVIKF